MAEYRMLRDDDRIQKGDEFKYSSGWDDGNRSDNWAGHPVAEWPEGYWRRPLPERGESFDEWHKRECFGVRLDRPMCAESEGGDLDIKGRSRWNLAGLALGTKFAGKYCREVWESERFVGVDHGKDDGTAIATGHRTPDGKVVVEDVRYIPPGVTVAPAPMSLVEHGPGPTLSLRRVCPSCRSEVPGHLERCVWCHDRCRPVFAKDPS